MSGHDLGDAIRAEAARIAGDQQGVHLAVVVDDSPLTLELMGTRHVLHEDELSLSQGMKGYLDSNDLRQDDVVTLLRKKRSGHVVWIVTDVVTDSEPASLSGRVTAAEGRLTAVEGALPFVGQVIPSVVSTPPDATWLDADGAGVTAAHPALRAKLIADGSPHGSSGGNPKLPDLRGGFPLGASAGHAQGTTGGAETVTLTSAQSGVPAHNHGGATTAPGNTGTPSVSLSHAHGPSSGGQFLGTAGSGANIGTGGGGYAIAPTTDASGALSHTHPQTAQTIPSQTAADAASAHNNMPPYVALHFFVYAGPA